MDLTRRNYWGWGYADKALTEVSARSFMDRVKAYFKLSKLQALDPPKIEDLNLRNPRFKLPSNLASFCIDDDLERAGHTYGKSFRDVVRGVYGQFDNPPDYVAYPKQEDEIILLMRFCEKNAIALIPYGGGSSVVGGVEQPRSDRFKGSISCDMCHFDKILSVNTLSRTARIQAGIYGPDLEAGLKPHGFTLRHFPQSFEFSTLGGWIATRAGGHFASLYTHIDDFVQRVRLVTPSGIVETRELPGSGDGPDANRLYIGSEGIFGIITEATVRLQSVPSIKATASVRFADETNAVEAVRQISQSGLYPSNCRLISPIESLSMGIGDGNNSTLLLGFESHDHPQEVKLLRSLDICKTYSGKWSDKDVFCGTKDKINASSTSEKWKEAFLRAPYTRDYLIRCGIISETFETSTTWDNFEIFHSNVIKNTQDAIGKVCGKGVVMWRFTHVYPDGPAVYYTVFALGKRGSEIVQWDAIKKAASDTIIQFGGPITHHHAVGRDHRLWYERSISKLYGRVLKQTKITLDPQRILNPGVLINEDEA